MRRVVPDVLYSMILKASAIGIRQIKQKNVKIGWVSVSYGCHDVIRHTPDMNALNNGAWVDDITCIYR